jgi:cob(I)alamin adenosyltransferase
MKVGIVQFIKGRGTTGEEAFFSRFPEVSYHVTGDGFTWDTQNKAQDEATARTGWDIALKMLEDPRFDLVILDELNIVLKYHYLPLDEVLDTLKKRPPMQHVIITGRGAPEGLINVADTVTEMRMEKHAFKAGIKAQRGVEF